MRLEHAQATGEDREKLVRRIRDMQPAQMLVRRKQSLPGPALLAELASHGIPRLARATRPQLELDLDLDLLSMEELRRTAEHAVQMAAAAEARANEEMRRARQEKQRADGLANVLTRMVVPIHNAARQLDSL